MTITVKRTRRTPDPFRVYLVPIVRELPSPPPDGTTPQRWTPIPQ